MIFEFCFLYEMCACCVCFIFLNFVYVCIIYGIFTPSHHGALLNNRVEGLGLYYIRDDGIHRCHARSTVFAS